MFHKRVGLKLTEEKRFLRYSLEEMSRCKKILDVGGGSGSLKNEALSNFSGLFKDSEIVTLDINPDRKPDIVGDAQDLSKFPPASFDGVFFVAVLQYLKSPQKAIDGIRRVLKKGGKLFMTVSYIYPYIPFEPVKAKGAGKDYFRFSADGLGLLLKDFSKVEVAGQGDYADVTVSFLTGFKFRRESWLYRGLRWLAAAAARPFLGRGEQYKNTCLGFMVLATK